MLIDARQVRMEIALGFREDLVRAREYRRLELSGSSRVKI